MIADFIEEYNNCYELNFTVLRYGSLYGPRSQEWNGMLRFISQIVKDNRLHNLVNIFCMYPTAYQNY